MIAEIKRLEGWMTFGEAADELSLSRQRVHKMVWDEQEFASEDIRAIGDRPLYVLRAEAVLAKRRERERRAAEQLAAE